MRNNVIIAYLRKLPVYSIVTFLCSMILCSLLLAAAAHNRYHIARAASEQLMIEKSGQINDAMLELLTELRIISYILAHNYCTDADIILLASALTDNPSVLSIKIAPNGIISYVYPKEGNEPLIGLDFFEYNPGFSYETINLAEMAKESRDVVLGGPFMVPQAEQHMIGKFPVYISEPCVADYFWGIIGMMIYYPQVLYNSGLHQLSEDGISCAIWRIYPDNNEVQMLYDSGFGTTYTDLPFYIANASWNFRIWDYHSRYTPLEIGIAVIASILISVLLAAFVKKRYELKKLHSQNLLERHIIAMKLLVSSLEKQDHTAQEEKKRWALFRHDIRHFHKMMLTCINNGDTEGMRKLIDEIDTGISKIENVITLQVIVGHRLVDGVLCHFMDAGKELGIDVTVQMQKIEHTSVNMTELAVTLSNSLENAVNACKKMPEGEQRAIKVIGVQYEKHYLIEISNTCPYAVEFDPDTGLPHSSEDGGGFGTQSIAYFAEMNNAHLQLEYKDGWYLMRLLLR